jgi:hypothetical protein
MTYDIRQSSLVPAATAPPVPTNTGLGHAWVSDSTIVFLDPPELAPNENAGLWIPRTQVELALGFHASDHFGMRGVGLVGAPWGAMAAAPTTLPNPGTSVFGGGLAMSFRGRGAGDRVYFDFDVACQLLSVPSYVIIDDSGSVPSPISSGHLERDEVWLGWIAIVPHVVVNEDVTLLGSFSLRNHPTNLASFTSTEAEAEVEEGPVNLVVALGAEVHAEEWLDIVPIVQWPVTRDPVVYGPIIGVGARATFERPGVRPSYPVAPGPRPPAAWRH